MRSTLAAIATLFSAAYVHSSHFRGGTISWEHLGSNGNVHRTRFSYRFGYRRNYFSDVCDDDMINNREPGYRDGNWQLTGGVGSLATTDIICTAYDLTENWAYGYNSFETNITISGAVSLLFFGNAWIGGTVVSSAGSWSMIASNIDFSIRSDTGRVNRAPATFSLPIVRLQQGCASSIDIKWTDADNDRVTCRYANGTEECGSVCYEHPHFSLDGDACKINYDGSGGAYLVPVAIVLEDHPRQDIFLDGSRFVSQNDSLSQIPLQFLVQIVAVTTCNVLPTYPSFAIPENASFSIPRTGTLNETLLAYPSDSSLTIVQFIVLGPLGVVSSGIYTYVSGLYAVDISWQPDPTQSGEYIICYHAVDSGGNNGQQRCFAVIAVASSNPCELDNGGCSDICIAQGPNSYCACSIPCWSLIHDRKTCAPDMTLFCTGDKVDLYVAGCASNRTAVAGTSQEHFVTDICQSKTENNQHHLNFSSHECGVTYQVNPVEVQYSIHLWIWQEEYTGSNIITRGVWRMVPITCSLPSNSSVAASFVPILPLSDEFFPQEVIIEEIGTLTLYFEFYRDSTFSVAFGPNDYPLEVRIEDNIYFALGAVGRPGLIFFTEVCIATATNPSDGSLLSYTLIDDGCFLESTLEGYASANEMQDRFSMRAFEFRENLVADRQDADITIQCQVILCDATDNTTRCFQGCQPGSRRRRSPDSIDYNFVSRFKRNAEEEEELPPALSQSPPQSVNTRIVLIGDDDDGNASYAKINRANRVLIGIAALLLAIGAVL